MTRNTGIIVDKTLTCKAFVKRGRAPVCVSLPRRFGKTFNLSTIEEFLNVANSSDTHPVNGQMDEQACHQAHERLFDGTMLKDRVSVVQPVLLQAPSDLPRTQDKYCEMSLLFTLLLYTNHLTLWQSSALRIPDGEHRRAWDDVLLTAILNNNSGNA
ncbi:hypothetical protein GQ54DRAFT_314778 [Martensiomyces pterosporus]|nr:hypothetical protein GQ54DRAFT_314778 [Martensiomyces pterosporus]